MYDLETSTGRLPRPELGLCAAEGVQNEALRRISGPRESSLTGRPTCNKLKIFCLECIKSATTEKRTIRTETCQVTVIEAVQFLTVTALPHAQNEEQQKAEIILWFRDLKFAVSPAPFPNTVRAQNSLEEVSQKPI
jgi:hypothetical protein